MRGFLAILDTLGKATTTTNNADIDTRLSNWKRQFPESLFKTWQIGNFSLFLYSNNEVSCEYNQICLESEHGRRLAFFTGPRSGLSTHSELSESIAWDWIHNPGKKTDILPGQDLTLAFQFDANANQLRVKTDILNSTYIYTAQIGKRVYFSNSSLTLAQLLGAEPNPEAAVEFLCNGSILDGKSLYQGISLLPPATFSHWNFQGEKSQSEYWRIQDIAFGTLRLSDAMDQITDLVSNDFARLKSSVRPFVLDLTGGYDSRCNFGFALNSGMPFTTIVSGQENHEDVLVAKKIAREFGLVIQHISPSVGAKSRAELLLAGQYTDFEYDIIEYSEILRIHSKFYAPEAISIHGSTADIMRNYFLIPGTYFPNPNGEVNLSALSQRKFPAAIDTQKALQNQYALSWFDQIQASLKRIDLPGLPAYARLDNIYLRVRMQIWQGRIGSATNRIHSSFTPWTSSRMLDTILATKWEDKKSAMLSRALITSFGKGLADFPMAGGSVPGTSLAASLRSIPGKMRDFSSRARNKLATKTGLKHRPQDYPYAKSILEGIGHLEYLLSPKLIHALKSGGIEAAFQHGILSPVALNRILTLIEAHKFLKS